ncbi:virion structural protein [Cyanophage S-RIM32]|uniref:Virion structural protein n=1 Tax=Cyanophage S-RIM32 TaxID=1278479 RepID=A0A127KMA8_9CAUD|nr:virion structural protein [Cyanophage S-RIM32]AMO43111.1 virion structural protein [Cyanophage S-RIM32]
MAELTLSAPYNEVTKRDGTTVLVENFSQRSPSGFSSFTSGTAGPRLKDFEKYKFEGDNIIDDISRAFPNLAIRDFEERALSSFTLSGLRFNIGPAGMVMGVTLANGTQVISNDSNVLSTITVDSTEKFYESGHLFTSSRQLIEYTSKTATTFTGYVVSGPNTLNNNDELVQFSGPE